MEKVVPFLKAKLTGKISVEVGGESVFGSNINFSLVITEENGANLIEELTPQIMELVSQAGEVFAQKIAQSQPTQREPDPFDALFR